MHGHEDNSTCTDMKETRVDRAECYIASLFSTTSLLLGVASTFMWEPHPYERKHDTKYEEKQQQMSHLKGPFNTSSAWSENAADW